MQHFYWPMIFLNWGKLSHFTNPLKYNDAIIDVSPCSLWCGPQASYGYAAARAVTVLKEVASWLYVLGIGHTVLVPIQLMNYISH